MKTSTRLRLHESLTPRCGRVKWRTFLFWFPDDFKKKHNFFFLSLDCIISGLGDGENFLLHGGVAGTVRMKQAIFPAWGPFLLFLEGAWNKLNHEHEIPEKKGLSQEEGFQNWYSGSRGQAFLSVWLGLGVRWTVAPPEYIHALNSGTCEHDLI